MRVEIPLVCESAHKCVGVLGPALNNFPCVAFKDNKNRGEECKIE